MTTSAKSRVRHTTEAKAGYHHGDLREALIGAARQIVGETGAENFSLADACRRAGVSTAAPYRHFKDREEILAEVCALGFDQLSERTQAAANRAGPGTIEAIIAMGQAYLAFATAEQEMFRLMFGQNSSMRDASPVLESGPECFGHLIEEISRFCAAAGIERSADQVALRMWTFVHGVASLMIDKKYDMVGPGVDGNELIAAATPLLIGSTVPAAIA